MRIKEIDGLLCVENQDNLEELINYSGYSRKIQELAD
jgi:hypothetical protein